MQPGGRCIIDIVGVFVRVSCPKETDRLTDQYRHTETDRLRQTDRDRQTETDRPRQTYRDKPTETDRPRQTDRDEQIETPTCHQPKPINCFITHPLDG